MSIMNTILSQIITRGSKEDFNKKGAYLETILNDILDGNKEVADHKSELSDLGIKEIYERLPNKDVISGLVGKIEGKYGDQIFAPVEEIIG